MDQQNDVAKLLNALARSIALAPITSDENVSDEVFEQVMELEYNENLLSVHLGVSKDLFVPLEQLEDDEVALIVERAEDALDAYNYVAEFPDGMPVRAAYTALLSIWDEKVSLMPFGTFHFDFYDMNQELNEE